MALAQVRQTEDQKAAAKPLLFAMHYYDAQKSHFDLHLEIDGILKTWRVSEEGPSYFPGEHREAILEADHSLSYAKFEGEIQDRDNGTVQAKILDQGYWEMNGDPKAALEEGHLGFLLEGSVMKGFWHLDRAEDGSDTWILRKEQDDFAMAAHESQAMIARQTGQSIVDKGHVLRDLQRAMMWMPIPAPAPNFNARKAYEESAPRIDLWDPARLIFIIGPPIISAPHIQKMTKSAANVGIPAAIITGAAAITGASVASGASATSIRNVELANIAHDGVARHVRSVKNSVKGRYARDQIAAVQNKDIEEKKAVQENQPDSQTASTQNSQNASGSNEKSSTGPEPIHIVRAIIVANDVILLDENGNNVTYLYPAMAESLSNEYIEAGLIEGLSTQFPPPVLPTQIPEATITSNPDSGPGALPPYVYGVTEMLYADGRDFSELSVLERRAALQSMLSENFVNTDVRYRSSDVSRAESPQQDDFVPLGAALIASDVSNDFDVASADIDAPEIAANAALSPGVSEPPVETMVSAFPPDNEGGYFDRQPVQGAFESHLEPEPGPDDLASAGMMAADLDTESAQEPGDDNSPDDNGRDQQPDNTLDDGDGIETTGDAPTDAFNANEASIPLTGLNMPSGREAFPGAGATKEDVATYYAEAASDLMPYMEGHPVMVVKTSETGEQETEIVHIADENDLMTQINMGAVQFHVMPSSDNPELPEILSVQLPTGRDAILSQAALWREKLEASGFESFVVLNGSESAVLMVPVQGAHHRLTLEAMAVEFENEIGGTHVFRADEIQPPLPFSVMARPGVPVANPVTWENLEKRLNENAANGPSTLKAADRQEWNAAMQKIMAHNTHAVSSLEARPTP